MDLSNWIKKMNNMLAVIQFAGTQFTVKKHDIIKVNKLSSEIGEEFTIDSVLSLIDGEAVKIGTPTLTDVKVTAKVIEQKRDAKIIVFKKKRRKHHRRKNGHRQYVSMVEIIDIQ